MHFDWIWKAILIITVGSLLLRLTGRTSIGKLSFACAIYVYPYRLDREIHTHHRGRKVGAGRNGIA
ncbi:hypothetical protein [Cohnella yongneupensis]|uniref:Uncharacterized protein n=1 Tax=Cohnella yongneupensis TaxID=425006 RepID=A0ABW0QTD3_9BACL